MVGAGGFEPPASWSRTKRAIQAALRPDFSISSTMSLFYPLAIIRQIKAALPYMKPDAKLLRGICRLLCISWCVLCFQHCWAAEEHLIPIALIAEAVVVAELGVCEKTRYISFFG